MVPSHLVGALSVRPKRMRTPTSAAKTGHANVTASRDKIMRRIGDAADATNDCGGYGRIKTAVSVLAQRVIASPVGVCLPATMMGLKSFTAIWRGMTPEP